MRRSAHPTDRRSTLVILTQDGGALRDGWNEGYELARRLFHDVPDDELNGFEVILGHVLERFRDNQSLDR